MSGSTSAALVDQQDHLQRDRLSSTRSEELSTRVEEYLRVTRLGREAFVDGDLKLAKDRFSLSMNIELNTDLECVCDPTVGKATGELRHELEARFNGFSRLLAAGSNPDTHRKDRYRRVMDNLLQVFLQAEEKMAQCPSEPGAYLQMASTLIVVNEWEKAKQVYYEGMSNCPDRCDELEQGLERLNKVERLAMLFQHNKVPEKLKRRKRLFGKKRPSSAMLIYSADTMTRSPSFDRRDSRDGVFLSPPTSPLASPSLPRKNMNTDRISAIASPMTHRRRSSSIKAFLTLKKKTTGTSPLVAERKNSLNQVTSLSMENISSIGSEGFEDKKEWRLLFNPDVCSSCVDDGLSTQSVHFMRMLGTMDADTLASHAPAFPSYTVTHANSDSSSEESNEF